MFLCYYYKVKRAKIKHFFAVFLLAFSEGRGCFRGLDRDADRDAKTPPDLRSGAVDIDIPFVYTLKRKCIMSPS